MALLTAVDITNAVGTQIDFVAATAATGDQITLTNNRTKALVNNGSGAPITVTVSSYKTVGGGLTVPDRTVTVAAGKLKAIPLARSFNGNPADSYRAKLVCSSVTTVTIAAVID